MHDDTLVRLHDTYMTELAPLGCVPLLEPAVHTWFTRSYHKGRLQYGSCLLDAEFIEYVSGNIQVLSVTGDGSGKLLQELEQRKRKHRFTLALRTLSRYFYFTASPAMGTLTLYMLLTWNVRGILGGCLFIMMLRLLYTASRNHLR